MLLYKEEPVTESQDNRNDQMGNFLEMKVIPSIQTFSIGWCSLLLLVQININRDETKAYLK